jgi:hypothetical protein
MMKLLEKFVSGEYGTGLTKSESILFDLIADLNDRSGLKQEWLEMDEEIQEEILETWKGIIDKYL